MNQSMLQLEPTGDEKARAVSLAQRAVYAVSLVAVLPVALAAALCGWRWQPWPPGRAGYKSALSEATLTARNVTAIAFSVK
jgi:hypothetical protein